MNKKIQVDTRALRRAASALRASERTLTSEVRTIRRTLADNAEHLI